VTRRFQEKKLVVATHNAGKLAEFRALLSSFGVDVVSSGDLGLPEPEETGKTFLENAALKALAAAKTSNLPALADDSGLCVAALGGEPGVYSARWGGPEKDMRVAMQRVHEAMGDNEDKSACFICSLVLAWPDGHTENVEGRVDGTFVWPPRGTGGMGYDPAFVPDGETRSFAEMEGEEKNKISHRGEALRLLVERFFVN
jgi:XTP/dITP diphosphohydrolase